MHIVDLIGMQVGVVEKTLGYLEQEVIAVETRVDAAYIAILAIFLSEGEEDIAYVRGEPVEIGLEIVGQHLRLSQQLVERQTGGVEESKIVAAHEHLKHHLLLIVGILLILLIQFIVVVLQHAVQTPKQREGQNHVLHLGVVIHTVDYLLDVPYHSSKFLFCHISKRV